MRALGLLLLVLAGCTSSSNEPRATNAPPSTTAGHDAGTEHDAAAPPSKPAVVQKDIAAIDAAVGTFMKAHGIPGVAIAITRNEKLVYAKGYGQHGASDPTPVTNASLFRIASISKPLTSAGIMLLVQRGVLTLDRTVFGPGGVLTGDFTSTNLAAMSDITVDQLLHHTTGNWPNDGTDPMFAQQAKPVHELVQWALDTYPDRGKRGTYQYSNFGYCLLGRIIEKLSGKTYEKFIADEILAPAGITAMTLGGSTLAERKPNEVIYKATDDDAYSMNIARMDSHGGWLASATDLVRFAVRVDGFASKPDLLSTKTITVMTTASSSNPKYACGWSVNEADNWWHTGRLPGTASELIRAKKGFNWAILANAASGSDTTLAADMDKLLWPFVNDPAAPWQDEDQL